MIHGQVELTDWNGCHVAYQIVNAQLFELEDHAAKVRPQNLGVGLLLEILLEGGFCVQPEALAWLRSASTSCSLMCTSL